MKFGFLGLSAVFIAMSFGSGCNTPSQEVAADTPCTNCSAITPENFVSSLVSLAQSGKINSAYANSTLVKAVSLQPGSFVIWDGATQNYMAVRVTSNCTSGNGCSSSDPTDAALALANGSIANHTVITGTNVTSSNGTFITGSFGNLAQYYGTDDYDDGIAGSVSGINLLATNQTDATGNPIYTDTFGDGELYSQNSATRDTDLQQASLQQTSFAQRAAAVSANFQMDFQKAIQLTTLSDKLAVITSQGQALSSDDRAAMMQTLSGIAGVTSDDLTAAVTAQLQGDPQPTSDLLDTISKNLGMPSSATLKGQILPQLGIDLN